MVDLGRRIKRAAQPFEREIYRVRAGNPRRPPVDHVLEEVADPVVDARLVTRTDAGPQRHVGAVQRRKRCNDDS